MPNWLFFLLRIKQRLWVTVTLYSVFGMIAALVAAAFRGYVPGDFPLKLGSEAVDEILTILASSMLAVATFSLATLVTAYTSVASNVAPHAAKLLVSDGAIRSSLATFLGAFLYSMVGIIALHTGYYGSQGRVILFFTTVAVLLLVVLAMLRWIGELSSLAQVDDVIDRVVKVTERALRSPVVLRAWRGPPYAPPEDALEVLGDRVGHVGNIDLEGLERLAAELSLRVYVEAPPGMFVHPAQPVLRVAGRPSLSGEMIGRLRGKIAIGPRRTFEQDPRFGLTVLGEIAGRALSPGVNDPGTARDVVSSAVGMLVEWVREAKTAGREPETQGVYISPLAAAALIEDALGPVARDGAGNLSLQLELQIALRALSLAGDDDLAQAAREHSKLALDLALAAAALEADRLKLSHAAGWRDERPL